jgi:hypothetical protein
VSHGSGARGATDRGGGKRNAATGLLPTGRNERREGVSDGCPEGVQTLPGILREGLASGGRPGRRETMPVGVPAPAMKRVQFVAAFSRTMRADSEAPTLRRLASLI